MITQPTCTPSFSTSSRLLQPQSRKMFSRLGDCSSLPGVRTWIAGQPNTAFTMPLSVWMFTRLLGAIWWSLPPLRFT